MTISLHNLHTLLPSDAVYNRHAERFKLLAHAERLRILDILRKDAECVCHLEAVMGKPQPYISQQLRILREAGVIADERDGSNVFYRLVDDELRQILNYVYWAELMVMDAPLSPPLRLAPNVTDSRPLKGKLVMSTFAETHISWWARLRRGPQSDQTAWIFVVALALVWFALWSQLLPLTEWMAYQLFRLQRATRLGEAVAFFSMMCPRY
ncbi:MAG: metalloregulator ArsR/SmtB family transcription factor [Caldilineaceae bacterium]